MPDPVKILTEMAEDLLYHRATVDATLLQKVEALRAGARAIATLRAQEEEEEMLP